MSSLLPNNATALEDALSESIARITDVPVPTRDAWNASTCPAGLLPWLAWAYSVDEWDVTWSDEQKRSAIKRSVSVHRYKGTIGAVREALAALGVSIRVQEWFNQVPTGTPYTYRLLLEADQVGIGQDELQRMFRVVTATKNLRSHMEKAVPSVTTRATLFSAGINGIGSETAVKTGTPTYSDGFPVIDVLTDAAFYGEASTIAGLDALDNIVRVQMPAQSWAQP